MKGDALQILENTQQIFQKSLTKIKLWSLVLPDWIFNKKFKIWNLCSKSETLVLVHSL